MNKNCKCGVEFVIGDNTAVEFDICDDTECRFDMGTPVVKITDYNELINKPSINGVELVGELTSADLLIPDITEITYDEIEALLGQIFG